MAKVLHIRGVPDDVHEALTKAAELSELSLTRYMLRELEHIARRAHIVQHNAAVVRRTRALVEHRVDRAEISAVLSEGREE